MSEAVTVDNKDVQFLVNYFAITLSTTSEEFGDLLKQVSEKIRKAPKASDVQALVQKHLRIAAMAAFCLAADDSTSTEFRLLENVIRSVGETRYAIDTVISAKIASSLAAEEKKKKEEEEAAAAAKKAKTKAAAAKLLSQQKPAPLIEEDSGDDDDDDKSDI